MKTGARDAYLKSPSCGKTNYTVLFCGSASGVYLPPLVVFAAEHVYESWMENGPPGTRFACSPKGYMLDVNFESWFIKVFVEHVKNYDKPVVIVYDGHNSHITYDTMKIANDNQIIVVCLPAHTSHAMQPLDVAVFKAVKVQWKKILFDYFQEFRARRAVDKSKFGFLLGKLWPKLNPIHMINGFQASGLYPIDPSVLDRRIVGILGPNEPQYEESTNISCPEKRLNKLVSVVDEMFTSPTTSQPRNAPRKRIQAQFGEVLTRPEALERLRLEKEERAEKLKAKKAEKEMIKKVKKDAKDAEKARKNALKEKEQTKKQARKKAQKGQKGKKVKKVEKRKKAKESTVKAQIGRALNYHESSNSDCSSSEEDIDLVRKDLNNSWSSVSSEPNTSDLLPSADEFDDADDLPDLPDEPVPSTSRNVTITTNKKTSKTKVMKVKNIKTKNTAKPKLKSPRKEAWIVDMLEEEERIVESAEVEKVEKVITKDDPNVVEVEIDGEAVLLKENVSYVCVSYEGENWPGMI